MGEWLFSRLVLVALPSEVNPVSLHRAASDPGFCCLHVRGIKECRTCITLNYSFSPNVITYDTLFGLWSSLRYPQRATAVCNRVVSGHRGARWSRAVPKNCPSLCSRSKHPTSSTHLL